ncbi:MAG TPA: hypothetical protein VH161_07910 [Candidatus Acidoferrales bacterium]|nr:hypothetical protein [Candidatus Acidoferrales bacterium]
MLMAIPGGARSATLEESARELARRIVAALPSPDGVTYEIRSASSLKPEEFARIEQALRAELQAQGVRPSEINGAAIHVSITLSENFQGLVWTGEIHQAGNSRTVLVAVERPLDNHAITNTLPVTIRSEKFWEGPERILDAGELSDGAGKSWLIWLRPDGLAIQNRQSGAVDFMEIDSAQSTSREPTGKIDFAKIGNTLGLYLPPRMCTVDLRARALTMCLPTDGAANGPVAGRDFLVLMDLSPGGPPPPGKGMELAIAPVCGSSSLFLATADGDDTHTDSVQLFETEPGGHLPRSKELDFPGPIIALHVGVDAPRAVVRNLATGNYEAYRLSFTCGQ